MICRNCTTKIPDTAKFCPKCGIRVEGPERSSKAEGQEEMILCPRCGTPSPVTANFCRKDGTSLKDGIRLPEPKGRKPETTIEPKPGETPTEAKEEEKLSEKGGESDKLGNVISQGRGESEPVTALFCKENRTLQKAESKSSGIAAPGNKVGAHVRAEMKAGIFPCDRMIKKVSRKPMRIWIWLTVFVVFFTIAGAVSYVSFSGLIRKKPSKVTRTPETFKPPVPPYTPQKAEPEIEKPLAMPLNGEVAIPASPVPGVPPVVLPHPPPPPVVKAKLEGDINRALRRSGLRGVSAVVSDDLSVVLKGSAGSAEEKNRAFVIAKNFKKAKGIRDIIFIVEDR
jgi:ribosomal protein L40E